MLQKESAPFTARDLDLRARLLELFLKERPTFLPGRIPENQSLRYWKSKRRHNPPSFNEYAQDK